MTFLCATGKDLNAIVTRESGGPIFQTMLSGSDVLYGITSLVMSHLLETIQVCFRE
jgi:hypothetical protein